MNPIYHLNRMRELIDEFEPSRERSLAATKLDECEMWLARCTPTAEATGRDQRAAVTSELESLRQQLAQTGTASPPPAGPGHGHAEAFKLMTYRSDDGTESETIWNSRDGVTPFVITLRSGKQATHVDWQNDRYAPDHKPAPGDRIFVDLTRERALEFARANLERYAQTGADMAKAPSAEHLADDWFSRPGAPDLIEVTG
jgi:hypothetical protein